MIRFHVILGWTLLVSVWGIDAIKTMAPCYVVFCIEQCYTWLDVVFWIDQISCFLELEAMNSVKQERLVLSNAEFLLPENLYMLSTEHFLPRLHVSVIHGFWCSCWMQYYSYTLMMFLISLTEWHEFSCLLIRSSNTLLNLVVLPVV